MCHGSVAQNIADWRCTSHNRLVLVSFSSSSSLLRDEGEMYKHGLGHLPDVVLDEFHGQCSEGLVQW